MAACIPFLTDTMYYFRGEGTQRLQAKSLQMKPQIINDKMLECAGQLCTESTGAVGVRVPAEPHKE